MLGLGVMFRSRMGLRKRTISWPNRKQAMSLITAIDWLPCLSSPPLAGVIFGRGAVTAGPLERRAGDPLAD